MAHVFLCLVLLIVPAAKEESDPATSQESRSSWSGFFDLEICSFADLLTHIRIRQLRTPIAASQV